MYLQRLDIHGFKSFATATELRFDSGITAIVGPNGSGKSNIVDALRWVIGEQRVRILRSDKMNNIIFNGSAKRRPLGMAEVRLTIENSRQVLPVEYTVITLGRRLYRSGEAEYLLNGTPCRLRDIQDLFSDTGMGAGAYSVIELKMIDEILSDKTQDRRRLFEEAAGLTKYKQRRSQAIRKLEITQDDLARVYDLTEEISRRVSGLKRQAATAARFKRYKERAQMLDFTLLQRDCRELEATEASVASNLQRCEDELTRWMSRTATDESTVEALRSALIAADNAAGSNQRALVNHRTKVTRQEAQLTLNQQKQSTIHRDLERLDQEQSEDVGRASELKEEAKRLNSELKGATLTAQAANEALAEAEQAMKEARQELKARQDTLREQRSQSRQYAETWSEQRRSLDQSENRLAWLGEEHTRLERKSKSLDLDRTVAAQRLEDARSRLEEREAALHKINVEHEAAQKRHSELIEALDETTKQLHAVGRIDAARAAEIEMLESLTASREGFPDGVRFLIEEGDSGPVRTVSDVVTCAPEYHAALAAALGDYGSCVIVQSRDEAFLAIQTLKANSQGRVLLSVLNEVGPPPVTSRSGGRADRPLRNLVNVLDESCARVIDLLLANIFCVDSLDEVADVSTDNSRQPARFVTKSGEWRDARGFMHGGGQARAIVHDHLVRRETLEKFRAEKSELESKTSLLGSSRDKVNEQIADLELARIEKAERTAENDCQSAQQQVRRNRDEHAALEKQAAEMGRQLSRILNEMTQLRTKILQSRARTSSAEAEHARVRDTVQVADEAIGELQIAAQVAQDDYAVRNAKAVESRATCDAVQRELERVHESELELERKAARRKRDSLILEAARSTLEQETEELKDSIRAELKLGVGLEDQVRGDRDKIMRLRVELKRVEDGLRKLRRGRDDAQKKVTEYRMQQVEVQTRLDEVNRRLAECGDLESLAHEELTEEEMRDERDALQRKMQGMGRVNALALEEYEKENERLEFMMGQCNDLQEAESTLNQTISEINVAAARQFMDVFDVIRGNFQELFEELFGVGATCDLVLPNADDVLESPIDIMAKPRGKRPVGIAQLSSGEKTLTAIALLFAIYLVKPSPFCFLDEVDAPLDDANIDRYMRLIRRFSDDTQFVLVTHNKRTMEMADRLYGITMQEQGVSCMVGVQFEQALAMAGHGV